MGGERGGLFFIHIPHNMLLGAIIRDMGGSKTRDFTRARGRFPGEFPTNSAGLALETPREA